MNPIIAVVPDLAIAPGSKARQSSCDVRYTETIQVAGGIPLIVPLTTGPTLLDQTLASCHGLLLIGGGDLAEPHYHRPLTGAERATLSGQDDQLDEMEIHLVRRALQIGLPLLGICRGMQLMNVAAGGTLIPDIPIGWPGAIAHRATKHPAPVHPVAWEPHTRLGQLLGSDCSEVNSTHHQAVEWVAPGFLVAARAPDGIIEAIEKQGDVFVAGVQFHPERLVADLPAWRRLFTAFVESSRAGLV